MNTSSLQPSHQGRNSLQGPVIILWDIENCCVPSDVQAEDVAGNIRMTLRVHPVVDGPVTLFSAYGDFSAFPKRLREGCQRTGVKLIDVPNGRKDAADKAILIDMFLFALDNPPPSSIMLISGDVDFAPALHILGQRGYTIILVIPSRNGVSSALSNAGRFVWDWPSVARGKGLVSDVKALVTPRAESLGWQINDRLDQTEEESIAYREVSRSCCGARDFSSQTLSENKSSPLLIPQSSTSSSGILSSCSLNEMISVQSGDLNGLKGQLVKLLELSGGRLPLAHIHGEYKKIYGKPLCASEYGAVEVMGLLKMMVDTISIEGQGEKQFVYYRNSKAEPEPEPGCSPLNCQVPSGKLLVTPPVEIAGALLGCHISGHEDPNEEESIVYGGVSMNCSNARDLSITSRALSEHNNCALLIPQSSSTHKLHSLPSVLNYVSAGNLTSGGQNEESSVQPGDLNDLKRQLVRLLDISGGCLPLIHILSEYQKLYGRSLSVSEFGVNKVKNLLKKMVDVIVIVKQGKQKFAYNLNSKAGPKQVCSPPNCQVRPPAQEVVTPLAEVGGFSLGCEINACVDENEEESIMYSGISVSSCDISGFPMTSQPLSECNDNALLMSPSSLPSKLQNLPSSLSGFSTGGTSVCLNKVNVAKPGDLNVLKGQLIKLLDLSGGSLLLTSLHAEYQKLYDKPLCVSEYEVPTLKKLLKKMDDAIALERKGVQKFVRHRNSKAGTQPVFPDPNCLVQPAKALVTPHAEIRNSKAGKQPVFPARNCQVPPEKALVTPRAEIAGGSRISQPSSEHNSRTHGFGGQNKATSARRGDINSLKRQLIKLLELSGGNLLLTSLSSEYQKTYGRPLCVSEYGVTKLKNLLEKMAGDISIEGDDQQKFVCNRNSKANRHKKGERVQKDNKNKVKVSSGSSDTGDGRREHYQKT